MGGLSIVSAKQANAAFETKLGWRVLAEPEKFGARVLRYKYCKGRADLEMFTPKQGMSNIWSGISAQAAVIRVGTAVSIGNGRNTLFWNHPWLDGISLSDRAILPVPQDKLVNTVADMWCSETGWNWDEFSDYLAPTELLKIDSYSVSPHPDRLDAV